MDTTHCFEALSQNLDELPAELRIVVERRSHDRLSGLIAQTLIAGIGTDSLLSALSEEVLADACGRVLEFFQTSDAQLGVQVAIGSILQFVPYFAEIAYKRLASKEFQRLLREQISGREQEYLLSLLRLLHFNHSQFCELVDLKLLTSLSSHKNADVRYLAARTLALRLAASDKETQDIASKWVDSSRTLETPGSLKPNWESCYRLFALEEHLREQRLRRTISENSQHTSANRQDAQPSDHVVALGGVFLPRPDAAHLMTWSNPISTSSTMENLKHIGTALKRPGPVLVLGQAGSGKSTLIRHAAGVLGKLNDMITLHLNEQSDAKTLIGIYTTGDAPGSFVWQAGVLTKAVMEGRWILIEDLERAPNEILSVLLPLIERRELAIPGRDQIVKAALGFRILATIRTSEDHQGKEYNPAAALLGLRHWTEVRFLPLALSELADIISGSFPQIAVYTETLVKTFEDLRDRQKNIKISERDRGATIRPISPRELLSWASRISALMGNRPTIDRDIEDQILLSGLDCFAGFLPNGPSREDYGLSIAQHVGIDPERFRHLVSDRMTTHKIQDQAITIGSYHFRRPTTARTLSSRSRTFSMNRHTSQQVERIAAAVASSEPLLLVGETGTGKTTSIQYLADVMGKRLTPFNMSQQSESGDLLGGFKPINTRTIVIPLQDEFDHLFKSTFPARALEKNQKFFDMLNKALSKQKWLSVCKCWDKAWTMFQDFQRSRSASTPEQMTNGEGAPAKKRRVGVSSELEARWERFRAATKDVEARLRSGADSAVAFSFVEGGVVKAAKEGDWILLDEINLASPDTLEALADLFDKSPSIMLTEAGSVRRITAHPEFRIFAAMNPATDVGKKDLPLGIRSRFTELYIDSPERDLQSLQQIVQTYLGPSEVALSETASRLHQEIQVLCESGTLVDGAGQKPHFSLRTLTRVLLFARDIVGQCSLRRALHEGFSMSYLTMLDGPSEQQVMPIIDKYFYGRNKKLMNELKVSMSKPTDVPDESLMQMKPYWLRRGSVEPIPQSHYIKTPSVQRNLDKLIRASMTRRFPILLQGPTSSGKTSMVEYLAKESGHKFVRINNHEHTDLQEYLGSYVSGQDGRLFFQEGLLVQAIREGHWIVLDELNLAPTDVLEALNRLLDDNRELLIPDTQEIVRPHPSFMIFATQNPAGFYGGRKMLSRAFRNRFLELHFDDIPVDELQTILVARSQKAPSWCELIVKVYKELSLIRQEGKVFEQKGFATLRDLFRWALRPAETAQELAYHGYMLLAERCRKAEEREEVRKIIEKVVGTKSYKLAIDPETLYDKLAASPPSSSVVWTKAMKRLYSLVSSAIVNNEPVLLVGETGCGKTTVCQVIAEARKQHLHIVNAHQNTETGDLIGAQRPARNRAAIEKKLAGLLAEYPNKVVRDALHSQGLDAAMKLVNQIDHSQANGHSEDLAAIKAMQGELKILFEWSDGSLIEAMKRGELFLLDEISLADDSVLERLNSVLEPSRSILLAEKGTLDSFVSAADGFQFFATMNPGGDYGKKELSPALRNRFTEIWVPALSDTDDVLQVIKNKLRVDRFAQPILKFAQWFQQRYNAGASSCVHIRDLLAWAEFCNTFDDGEEQEIGYRHGAAMVYIDSIGANPSGMVAIEDRNVNRERSECVKQLEVLSGVSCNDVHLAPTRDETSESEPRTATVFLESALGSTEGAAFLATETIKKNAIRVARALKLAKPILLEGAPGVGKTTLVADLASCAGIPLTRINLSEQTDLMDLFGSDVPVEGEELATFAWRDAPFLRAMKNGEWVLLDEMNLASQSILEGLNACLDHRGEVYIPELNQTFHRHDSFRLFAAQNPHHQGGGRKGLPASFVNRFTVVYAEVLQGRDIFKICKRSFADISANEIESLISVVERIRHDTESGIFGTSGSPWEFNLRDSKRWLELVSVPQRLLRAADTRHAFPTVILQRFRTGRDQRLAIDRHRHSFAPDLGSAVNCKPRMMSTNSYQVGLGLLLRTPSRNISSKGLYQHYDPRPHMDVLESCMLCIQKNWPVLLVGPAGAGKTALVERLASTVGASLTTFSINADVDSMDLVGGYEQHDPLRTVHETGQTLVELLKKIVISHACHDEGDAGMISLFTIAQSMATTSTFPKVEDLTTIREFLIGPHKSVSGMLDKADLASLDGKLLRLQKSASDQNAARFEWLDGTLVRAMRKGEWLVLDNANLCNPAALDRLNSLLEPNGRLIVNEHTDSDELSRALRNRCVELFMPDSKMRRDPHKAQFEDAALQRIHEIQSTLSNDHNEVYGAIAHDHLCEEDLPLWQLSRKLYEERPDRMTDQFGKHEDESGLCQPSTIFIEGFEMRVSRHPLDNPHPRLVASQEPPINRYADLLTQTVQFELSTQLHRMSEALQAIATKAVPGRALTKLSKSAIDPDKDGVFKALHVIMAGMRSHFMGRPGRALIFAAIPKNSSLIASVSMKYGPLQLMLDNLLRFWWDIYELADTMKLPDATLSFLGRHLIDALEDFRTKEHAEGMPPEIQDRVPNTFAICVNEAANMLGISVLKHESDILKVFWETFRPFVPSDEETSKLHIRLRALIRSFDSIVTLGPLEVGRAVNLRLRLRQAIATPVSEAEEVHAHLEGIERVLENLKTAAESGTTASRSEAHFKTAFESLNRSLDLIRAEDYTSPTVEDDELIQTACFLAGRTSESVLYNGPSIHAGGRGKLSTVLQQIISYGRARSEAQETSSSHLGVRLLSKARTAGAVSISQMPLLQTESASMGKLLASNTHVLARECVYPLRSILFDLLLGVGTAFSHDIDGFTPNFGKVLLDKLNCHESSTPPDDDHRENGNQVQRSGVPPHATDVRLACFNKSAAYFEEHETPTSSFSDYLDLAHAWIDFSFACLSLYIPSVPQDPAVRMMLDNQIHERHLKTITDEIEAIEAFEKAHGISHQFGSIRLRRARNKLEHLRQSTPRRNDDRVWRSPTSSVDALMSLLRSAHEMFLPYTSCLHQDPVAEHPPFEKDLQLRKNVAVLKQRLMSGFPDMQDLTIPIVGFLSCLEIGLDLYNAARSTSKAAANSDDLTRLIPLGGSPQQTQSLDVLVGSWLDIVRHGIPALATVQTFQLYSILSPFTFKRRNGLGAIAELLSYAHLQWKKDLEKAQTEHATKSSLYRYTGGDAVDDEAAEEEFADMFPDYEAHTGERKQEDLQIQASAFATTVVQLCVRAGDTKDTVVEMLDIASATVAEDHGGATAAVTADNMLPLAIRQLDKQRKALSVDAAIDAKAYNIYADTNIKQVLVMTDLVNKVRTRFRIIQSSWPEHATLADVLQTCQELVEFAHTEPLMKIITKLEKLHDQIHEWQTVASKEFSAETVYNNVTDLIVTWRQLELSTWSRMLDQEAKKCENDAKAWFFVAFESIVAGTYQFRDSAEGLHDYVLELLKTLDTFFRSTGLGQFNARMQIVHALGKLIEGADYLPRDNKALICSSIHNFLSYFRHFEKPVEDAIASKRKTLDADMKNVIQVASWKDRNILALKQSAKTSHRKLFKVIRKFRAVLSQPVDSIISTGPPNAGIHTIRAPLTIPVFNDATSTDPQSSNSSGQLMKSKSGWEQLPARFKNVKTTVSLIVRLSSVPNERPDGSAEITTWLSDTQATAEMLRKATPSLMTEENRVTAQHLKSRKRGLYADVLKSLRTMGFKSNLSTDVLAQQSSTVAVLTSTSKYDGMSVKLAEYNLHQLLHWMPQVRESGRQHSEDLTAAEVGRSTALLESMLQNIVTQRADVSNHIDATTTFEKALQQVRGIASASNTKASTVRIEQGNIRDGLTALIAVLETAQDLVAAHFRLAEENGTEQMQLLGKHATQLKSRLADWHKLSRIPENLTSDEINSILTRSMAEIDAARAEIKHMVDDNPPLGPLLSQVLEWTNYESWTSHTTGDGDPLSLEAFQTSLCTAVDQVLAAIETVPKTLAELPSSLDSPSWLVQEANTLNTAVFRLRVPEITTNLNAILSSLHRLKNDNLTPALAFVLSLAPIFEQYHKTCASLTSRLTALHTSTTSMAAILAKLYVTLARDGFCSPKEKDDDPQAEKDSGVESGTGLGDGEGAEDISKDIGDDEDLGELAQEKSDEKRDRDMEDEKDAVDMADQEMEGEYGDEQEKREEEGEEGEEGEEKEVESEAGSVDDLGEGTVDEKMWDDGGKEEDQKDQEAEKAEGTKSEDIAAAEEDTKEKEKDKGEKEDGAEGDEGEEEQVGAEEEENDEGERKDAERADPTMQQEENLDLPDDIEMDGQEKNDEADDDLDMMEKDGQETEEQGQDMDQGQDTDEEAGDEMPEQSENKELVDDEMDEKTNDVGETAEDDEVPEENDNVLQDNRPDDSIAADQVARTDARGTGLDEEQQQNEEDKDAQAGAAQRPQGAQGEDTDMQETSGAQGHRNDNEQQENGNEQADAEPMTAAEESFRKLGDAMEKWYKQRRDRIQDKREQDKDQDRQRADKRDQADDANMGDVDFEHLSDEEEEGDAQALGAAREDEATAIDEDAGTAVNEQERTDQFPKNDRDQAQPDNEDTEMQDATEHEQDQAESEQADDQRKAFVGEYREPPPESGTREASAAPSDDLSELSDSDNEEIPIQSRPVVPESVTEMDHSTALSTWNDHLSHTLPHSLQLQEQLRLILHPTSSTKLRGDFRTGKRLNIKRIIPYIASNYKRDKIWLRRSVPSKREYQIVIALDDSGSMAESGAGAMALDTVAMVGRALGMLEAGELSVVGFGRDVKVPISFGETLSVDKGVEVVRAIQFGQTVTDMKVLLGKTGEMFSEARARGGGRRGQTWQLMLIVGDGVFDDEEGVRRMERQMREERVMVVFVIIDADAGKGKGKGSIVDLKRPRFHKDADGRTQVEIGRYIETFPFRYYLIVRDVAELPNVLASALRQWFAEVAESG
ncbi:Midasin-like protein [Elsinoe fawcettii]|nr:Midasin-like protein [Elsinoe fawcettii]